MTTDTKFNGYMITFHCNYCGKNFKVVWRNIEKTPRHLECLHCAYPGADKMYQAEKEEVLII